jgi:hypothetical protein
LTEKVALNVELANPHVPRFLFKKKEIKLVSLMLIKMVVPRKEMFQTTIKNVAKRQLIPALWISYP